ncbi:hypothetical protein VitviT2T_007819 [Vitis vinifera]|uniref:Reverse transcriptase Ty1/copia-type domain-containing protein n=1 Tax=Vitis vinifera TaxID=29760 RepID=A0ABY9BZZ1_VITVI|nr:hypothetical protein VitviT2T_007819 [Vitis vinifera]
MQEELKMINKNETWQLVERPKNHKVIGVKWVFKTKLNSDGSICKHKARLVVKGYAQHYGVDYQETFALVARYDTIRLLFIYVEQPDGVVAPGKEDYVYLLRKALYGLKQAPRACYEIMDKHLTKLGFVRSQSEATLYVKTDDVQLLIVSLYVDDMLVTGNQPRLIQSFKDEINKVFEMTDLGGMKYFLGMEVMQSCSRIFICQQKYAMDMLKKFKMQDCKPVSTPMTTSEKLSKDDDSEKIDEGLYRSLIGSLLYLTASRPEYCLLLVCFPEGDLKLLGYSDSNWGGCVDDSRSTSGWISHPYLLTCRVSEHKQTISGKLNFGSALYDIIAVR